jgi:uncharacterized protein YciI
VPVFAVTYTYAPGSDDARDEVRPEHVEFLSAQHRAGRLLVSGPLKDESPGALLVIDADSSRAAAELLDADPFRRGGLIAGRSVRRWDVFFGGTLEGTDS